MQSVSGSARGGGASVSTLFGTVIVQSCVFSRNTVSHRTTGSGGGLHVYDASLIVSNSSFVSNRVLASAITQTAVSQGGGLWHGGWSLRLTNVLIASNSLRRANSSCAFMQWSYGGGRAPVYVRIHLTKVAFPSTPTCPYSPLIIPRTRCISPHPWEVGKMGMLYIANLTGGVLSMCRLVCGHRDGAGRVCHNPQ